MNSAYVFWIDGKVEESNLVLRKYLGCPCIRLPSGSHGVFSTSEEHFRQWHRVSVGSMDTKFRAQLLLLGYSINTEPTPWL